MWFTMKMATPASETTGNRVEGGTRPAKLAEKVIFGLMIVWPVALLAVKFLL